MSSLRKYREQIVQSSISHDVILYPKDRKICCKLSRERLIEQDIVFVCQEMQRLENYLCL